jgi:hypothetical protein
MAVSHDAYVTQIDGISVIDNKYKKHII